MYHLVAIPKRHVIPHPQIAIITITAERTTLMVTVTSHRPLITDTAAMIITMETLQI